MIMKITPKIISPNCLLLLLDQLYIYKKNNNHFKYKENLISSLWRPMHIKVYLPLFSGGVVEAMAFFLCFFDLFFFSEDEWTSLQLLSSGMVSSGELSVRSALV